VTVARLGLLGVLSAALACGGATPAPSDAQAVRPPADAGAARAADIATSRRNAITEAVARVAPAVVTVQTETRQQVPTDLFEMFFGGGRTSERVTPGIGSGFITRADGVIVTNAHVIAGASSVSVALRDGTTYPARVIGLDELNDVAVLRIDARDLPVAPLGDSDGAVIGEWVIAIGNPFGFVIGNTEPAVTVGVISATGRNLAARADGPGLYLDMIQTDASINPGNSGGPLVTAAGEVIGVNSSIYSPSGGSVGLGFAIPINRAKRITEELLADGRVRRPWIGVKVEVPTQGSPRERLAAGAVIGSVTPGSPAERAGLRAGDQIVRANGRLLRNFYDWEARLLDLRVGDDARLVVRRGTREVAVTVRVADLPEETAPKVQVLRELELVTLTPQIRAERGIRSARGAVVYRVSDRLQQSLGLQPGDVIFQVNRTAVASADEVARAVDAYAPRGPVRFFLERGGTAFTVDFRVR
jgi:serine protease Do